MNKRYFSMYQDKEKQSASIYIYGDITSWPWYEEDTSSYTLSKQLQDLEDAETIDIYLNSYGGEVAEGLAIYNALKRHKATINTYVDGFACSIASVIFMAGDNRYVGDTSLLMIHNAWTRVSGNSQELKKQAEDLEKITQASINAYMKSVSISEEDLKEMMDNETWIDSTEAIEKGFASELVETDEAQVANQSLREGIKQKLLGNKVVANINIEGEKLEEIVKNQVEKAMATFENKILEDEKPKNENKLNSFMKAFFDVENKEED